MKNLLSSILIFLLIIFLIQCKKKNNAVPSNNSTPASSSGTLTFKYQTTKLVSECNGSFPYSMKGTPSSGTYPSLTIGINGDKPVSSTSYPLSLSGTEANVTILICNNCFNNPDVWIATGGTLNITINGSTITASFTGATFTYFNGGTATNSTALGSGSLTCN